MSYFGITGTPVLGLYLSNIFITLYPSNTLIIKSNVYDPHGNSAKNPIFYQIVLAP